MKALFLAEKDLRNWWKQIVEDQRFGKVLLYVNSEFVNQIQNGSDAGALLRGAGQYAKTLIDICEAEETGSEMPSPGLNHLADKMPTRENPTEKPNANTDRPQT